MPKIDLASIPGLETAQALFGAICERAGGGGPGDDIIVIMVYVHDTAPPPPPGLF
jgi:hypothetical protein